MTWNINTETWAKGVYYFIINNGDKPITKQVIKVAVSNILSNHKMVQNS
jgi:hypothetical protein